MRSQINYLFMEVNLRESFLLLNHFHDILRISNMLISKEKYPYGWSGVAKNT